jgi:hypothetical protein
MFGLEIYSDAFGRPYTKLHKYRIPIVNIAFIDVFFTIMIAYFISIYTNQSIIGWTIGLFVVGEIFHYSFGVKTKVMEILLHT